MGVVLILAGGEPIDSGVLQDLPDPDFVIAADSGLDEALRLGIPVDLVVGDLDSASELSIDTARTAGVDFDIHSADKDKTDLELALDRAFEADPDRVVVVGGGGGRLDHQLANSHLIAARRYRSAQLDWLTPDAQVRVVHDETDIYGTEGDVVTIIPAGGPVSGVTTTGLRWRLDDEQLGFGSTRGISNELTGPTARISVTDGTLLVVMPRT